MKKYLFGFLAVIAAVGFSAFTKPAKNAFINYYRFTYVTSQGFTQSSVQNEAKAHWGVGVLAANSSDFTLACDGTDDRACELIVEEGSTTIDLSGDRVLKTSGTGAVSITAALGNDANIYYVSGGTNVTDKKNKN